MKYTYINKKWIVAFSVLSLLFSCKKTLDINVDPNNPAIESATPEVLFPAGVLSTAGMVGGQLAAVGGIWAQYYTQSSNSSQFRDIDAYNITNTTEQVNLPYEELFAGALADYNLAIIKSNDRKDYRYLLMNTVMKAYTYQVLVDLYDQVPYTEAFQGQANLQPKFDEGKFIYTSLIAEIDAALAKDYRSTAFTTSQSKTDFLFGTYGFDDEMDYWEKFANTLKLKMYLRMINADPAAAEAGIRALYTANAPFLDVDAGVAIFEDVPNRSNPFYEYNIRRLNTTTNIRASVTLSSYLIENDDARAVSFFGTASPSAMHQGDYAATLAQQPTYGNSSVFVQSATDPVHFISNAESHFMQAEALVRYFGGAGADVQYNAGLSAAFAQTGLTDADIPANYAYPAAGTPDAKLTAILTQKWVSFVSGSHQLEGFFEQNRTGIPAISPVYSTAANYVPGQFVYGKNGITGGKFPKRFPFPDYEKSRNNNTPAEVPITTKVWWAK
ncbi:MAG: hypothetical protein JWQ25_673 [Daejeonella sp.]|nr:hypothetical protein [Daejeonella sp.]